MPEVNNHNEKPWYRKSSSWAWITIGMLILTYIIVSAVTDAQEKRAKQNPVQAQVLQGSLHSGRGKEDGYRRAHRRARRLETRPECR